MIVAEENWKGEGGGWIVCVTERRADENVYDRNRWKCFAKGRA